MSIFNYKGTCPLCGAKVNFKTMSTIKYHEENLCKECVKKITKRDANVIFDINNKDIEYLKNLTLPEEVYNYAVNSGRVKNTKKSPKKFLIGLITIILAIVILASISSNKEDTEKGTDSDEVSTQTETTSHSTVPEETEKAIETENKVEDVDAAMLKVLTGLGYTSEHAAEIKVILNTLGINSISVYGKSGAGEAEKGLLSVVCYANGSKDRNKRFTFTTEDGVMFYAGFGSVTLYDSEQGGVLKTYTDALKES